MITDRAGLLLRAAIYFCLFGVLLVPSFSHPGSDEAALGAEVKNKGWIIFSAVSTNGDWDLFLMRPDGSGLRPFTSTPQWNEAWPQFSRDGKNILYRRIRRSEKISGNRYGEQGELVLARSDGSQEQVLGAEGELPWASWSPDGKEIATLSIKGVSIVNLESKKVMRAFARKGFFQQLVWSPDGQWLAGVANSFGTGWSVARMDAVSGAINPVSKVDCCTPDWFPDSKEIVYSKRPTNSKENNGQGWTQLWRTNADGNNSRLIYAEDGRHIYGGQISPDGAYALFTGNMREDGDPEHAGAPMGLLRLSDAPIITGESAEAKKLNPNSKSGPVLVLPSGWEPCWTFAPITEPMEKARQ